MLIAVGNEHLKMFLRFPVLEPKIFFSNYADGVILPFYKFQRNKKSKAIKSTLCSVFSNCADVMAIRIILRRN